MRLLLLCSLAFLVASCTALDAKPTSPTTLWHSLDSSWSIADKDDGIIDEEKDLLLYDKRDFLASASLRGFSYLPYLMQKTRDMQLPLELSLLPLIESGYNPKACSHKGACGLWQIMPTTGKMLGLVRSSWEDQRRNVALSTQKALIYLRKLHQRFGSWPLALAAYNCGPTYLSRAIRREGTRNVWELSLPRETRRYIARFFALKSIVKDHSYLLAAIPKTIPIPHEVTLNKSVPTGKLLPLLSLDKQSFSVLNPSIKLAYTPKHGTVLLAKNSPRPQALSSLKEKKLRLRKVRKGENLSLLAYRHKTSVATIKRLNHLTSDTIRHGKKLFIPQ